jgi:hypothetical protein
LTISCPPRRYRTFPLSRSAHVPIPEGESHPDRTFETLLLYGAHLLRPGRRQGIRREISCGILDDADCLHAVPECGHYPFHSKSLP